MLKSGFALINLINKPRGKKQTEVSVNAMAETGYK